MILVQGFKDLPLTASGCFFAGFVQGLSLCSHKSLNPRALARVGQGLEILVPGFKDLLLAASGCSWLLLAVPG